MDYQTVEIDSCYCYVLMITSSVFFFIVNHFNLFFQCLIYAHLKYLCALNDLYSCCYSLIFVCLTFFLLSVAPNLKMFYSKITFNFLWLSFLMVTDHLLWNELNSKTIFGLNSVSFIHFKIPFKKEYFNLNSAL